MLQPEAAAYLLFIADDTFVHIYQRDTFLKGISLKARVLQTLFKLPDRIDHLAGSGLNIVHHLSGFIR